MTTEARQVAVIGTGNWGTTLALLAARNGHRVVIWARDPEVARGIRESRRNPRHLDDIVLPELIAPTTSMHEALLDADYVFIAVPSHVMRRTVEQMREHLSTQTILIGAAKGIENGTLMRMSEVVSEVVGARFAPRYAVLSGPSFAREVAKGDPTAIVAASSDPAWSQSVQREFSSSAFRIYTNDDVVGVELGGAVKNVVAIAAGVVRGLGYGSNAVAAVVTRGLAEMTRLAVANGARLETMAGLAGLGDLVLTCTGDLSRNRHVGVELGRGRKLDAILAEMREIAEGVQSTRAILELGRRSGVSMPITGSVYSLLYEGRTAIEAANELMERPLKSE
jgi:glycerol-3-phosphate dehydrogenase (NAD(P)+)